MVVVVVVAVVVATNMTGPGLHIEGIFCWLSENRRHRAAQALT